MAWFSLHERTRTLTRRSMLHLRGLLILVALCAFGALEASFVGRHEYERYRHGLQHSNSSGKWNATLPAGNFSHPGLFRPGRSPGHHPFNSTNLRNDSFVPSWHHGGHFNASGHHNNSVVVPEWNPSWNHTGQWNASRPILGRRLTFDLPARGRSKSLRPLVYPSYSHRPAQQPVFRPSYNSTWYRPANNGSWYRPSNYSRPYYG